MPVGVLEILDYLQRQHVWFHAIDHLSTTLHYHITHNLLAVTKFLDQVSQQRDEVLLQISHVFLQEKGHDFYGCKAYFEVYVRNELVNESQEVCTIDLSELKSLIAIY